MTLPTFKQVKSITLAVLSGRDKNLQAERDAVCAKCPALRKSVRRNRWTNKLHIDSYCGKCGCGTRPMAGLRKNKNAYRLLECPDKLWPGDMDKRGGLSIHDMSSLVNVYERIELQLATVQMYIDDGTALTAAQFEELSGRELQQLRALKGHNVVPGATQNPKAQAVAAAARTAAQTRAQAPQAPSTDATARTNKDQIPDELVRKHFKKIVHGGPAE